MNNILLFGELVDEIVDQNTDQPKFAIPVPTKLIGLLVTDETDYTVKGEFSAETDDGVINYKFYRYYHPGSYWQPPDGECTIEVVDD